VFARWRRGGSQTALTDINLRYPPYPCMENPFAAQDKQADPRR